MNMLPMIIILAVCLFFVPAKADQFEGDRIKLGSETALTTQSQNHFQNLQGLGLSGQRGRICFLVGRIKENGDEPAKQIEELFSEVFGDEVFDNIFLHAPRFIEGFVVDAENIKSTLVGNREIMTSLEDSQTQQVSVCSRLESDIGTVSEIWFVVKRDFVVEGIFWQNEADNTKNLYSMPP